MHSTVGADKTKTIRIKTHKNYCRPTATGDLPDFFQRPENHDSS